MKPIVKNDTFDYGRFCHELKNDLRSKKTTLLSSAISAVTILATFCIGNLLITMGNRSDTWAFTPILNFTTICLCVRVSSFAFTNLNTVNGALTELTTPTSKLEKFISRWLVSIALPLAFCLAVMKGVEISALKAATFYYTHMWSFSESKIEMMKHPYIFTASWLIFTVWLQAIFFLGAAAWRRYSSIKTIAILTLMLFLAIAVWGNNMPWLGVTYSHTATALLVTLVPLCLYYAAWKLYSRAQVK